MITDQGKYRFTLCFPSNNQQTISFGDCNENSNDRAKIVNNGEDCYLYLYLKEQNYNDQPFSVTKLPPDTLVCDGWYEKERSEFIPVKDFKHT